MSVMATITVSAQEPRQGRIGTEENEAVIQRSFYLIDEAPAPRSCSSVCNNLIKPSLPLVEVCFYSTIISSSLNQFNWFIWLFDMTVVYYNSEEIWEQAEQPKRGEVRGSL